MFDNIGGAAKFFDELHAGTAAIGLVGFRQIECARHHMQRVAQRVFFLIGKLGCLRQDRVARETWQWDAMWHHIFGARAAMRDHDMRLVPMRECGGMRQS